jgi:hypothetical protein
MSYIPSPRDPLTLRFRRSVLETLADDPYAYSEGSAEPQLVDTPADDPGALMRAFERALDTINGRPWLTLAAGAAIVALCYLLGGAR